MSAPDVWQLHPLVARHLLGHVVAVALQILHRLPDSQDGHRSHTEVVPAQVHVTVLELLDVLWFDHVGVPTVQLPVRCAVVPHKQIAVVFGTRGPVPKATDWQVHAQVMAEKPILDILDCALQGE
eukprot:CAMPEP_0180659284 /NCGR_PEP_ID=MMETSP1037_2-20121125/57494_1 /TAXON_ID=632150 /ORGANISM="Azadinium spinosum, Strain 3D9" /LENGTH=124 /DNA_ID=CAMNT_0022686305 /DNA_START=13 /DNA_END=384 /DNA_ORIENTATION=+